MKLFHFGECLYFKTTARIFAKTFHAHLIGKVKWFPWIFKTNILDENFNCLCTLTVSWSRLLAICRCQKDFEHSMSRWSFYLILHFIYLSNPCFFFYSLLLNWLQAPDGVIYFQNYIAFPFRTNFPFFSISQKLWTSLFYHTFSSRSFTTASYQ